MGAQDNLAEAESFLTVYGGPATMLWSESSEPWTHYRAGNDSTVLLDGAGVTVIEKIGGFDPRRIEDALAELA